MKTAAAYPVSDHCDGRVFFNPDRRGLRSWSDVLRWKLKSHPAPWPRHVEIHPASRGPRAPTDCRVTWINHATFLIESPQGNFLIDPVYSKSCGPFGLLGPRRVHAPGIAFRDLPQIHHLLLSHDHYDHCDLPTLRALVRAHNPVAIAPLGNRDLLRRAGFSRIVELDWWQNHAFGPSDSSVTVTPARHWSNRLSGKRCGRLWGGFYLHLETQRVYFAGDSGFHETLFREIGQRLGPPDLALIPIGAYEPRWFMREQHCNPPEAVQIHRDLGAGLSIGMHWGTFQLTDEARDEPRHALMAAAAAAGLAHDAFRILEPGGSVTVSPGSPGAGRSIARPSAPETTPAHRPTNH